MSEEINKPVESKHYIEPDTNDNILFFFLLLVVLFSQCNWFEQGNDSLLLFFLLLIVIFCQGYGSIF